MNNKKKQTSQKHQQTFPSLRFRQKLLFEFAVGREKQKHFPLGRWEFDVMKQMGERDSNPL
jgi:hypothetical protein